MENNKLPYEKPNIEVIQFATEDIITISGGWRDPAELEEIPD